MEPPTRVQAARRGMALAKRGGVQPGNLPTETFFPTIPPSSSYRGGVPKIAGSEGGFFGVLFGALIVVALIALGACLFVRRRRRNRQLEQELAADFPGGARKGSPRRSGFGRAFGNPRKGWGKMEDDAEAGHYGDDAFEMGKGNPSTATLHAAPLSPDPSQADLPSYLHPSSAAEGAWPFSGPRPKGAGSSGNASDSSLGGFSEKDGDDGRGNWHHFGTPRSDLDLPPSEVSSGGDDFHDAADGKGVYEKTAT